MSRSWLTSQITSPRRELVPCGTLSVRKIQVEFFCQKSSLFLVVESIRYSSLRSDQGKILHSCQKLYQHWVTLYLPCWASLESWLHFRRILPNYSERLQPFSHETRFLTKHSSGIVWHKAQLEFSLTERVPYGNPHSDQVKFLSYKFRLFIYFKRISRLHCLTSIIEKEKKLIKSRILILLESRNRWINFPSLEYCYHIRFSRLHAPAHAFPPPIKLPSPLQLQFWPSKSART